jgi:ribose transport system permease protein
MLFGILNPVFISLSNLLNVIDQISIIGIIALGMTVVILTGGIDLSVGPLVAFSGLVLAISLLAGFGLPLSILFCLATGLGLGVINGFFISYCNVPAFIATLGLMSIARGASLYITDGRAVSNLPLNLTNLVSFDLFGISFSTILFLVLTLVFWFWMKFTYWGKYLYAIGGNEKAAWLSGIQTKKYKMLVYALCGLACAFGSLILVGKLNSAQPQAGNMYELNAIAAVVIGGASLSGGKGSISGTFLGVLILGVLQNGFSILNISPYYQQVLLGIIIIFAVLDKKQIKLKYHEQ